MKPEVKYQEFLEAFAAWDAAYRNERDTVARLYGSKLQDPADEQEVKALLAELSARRRNADELLAQLAAQFDDLLSGSATLH